MFACISNSANKRCFLLALSPNPAGFAYLEQIAQYPLGDDVEMQVYAEVQLIS
jgi:hypothetical protein